MNTTRKNFFKLLCGASAVCSIPSAFWKWNETKKFPIIGGETENPHRPIFEGWGVCLHYPVLENKHGEALWEKKSPFEIIADLNRGVAKVKELLRGDFDPKKDEFSIFLAPSRAKYLKKKLPYGVDVEWYVKHCWPNADLRYGEIQSVLETTGWNRSAEVIVSCCVFEGGRFRDILAYPQYGI